MKVLLINPGNYILVKPNGEVSRKNAVHPLGLACLGAYLEQFGVSVEICDSLIEGYDVEVPIDEKFIRYGLTDDTIVERINASGPDVVGVTTTHSCRIDLSLDICRLAKRVNPRIHTVLGGNHASALPEECLKDPSVDFVVLGEGEMTFHALLGAIEGNGTRLEDIDGLAYRSGELVRLQPKYRWIENLDLLPPPAWHLLPMEKYSEVGRGPGEKRQSRYAIMVTSRGCPHRCSYCPVGVCWGNRYRAISASNVIDQIVDLNRRYGVDTILFEEHNFVANRKRIVQLCHMMIEREIGITWAVPNGMEIAKLDRELLTLMRKAGCYALHLAIESGSKEVLERISKRVDLDQTREVISMGREMGFEISAFFMIGFPDQTRQEIEQTLAYAETLDLDHVHFFIATPIPGTLMFDDCIRNELLVDDFSFRYLRYGICNIETDEFKPDYIENARRRGWLAIMEKN